MRSIKLILTNNIKDTTFEDKSLEIYKFDKNESNAEELKKIVIDINKNQREIVHLITNKENLFEFFNRNIICEYFDSDNDGKNSILERRIQLNKNPWFTGIFQNVRDIFFNNINEVLVNYGNIFQIDIEKLVKGTSYNISNSNDFFKLIDEDLNLILFKGIITSRLCVVFYRLTYFDLDVSKASVGRFFANYLEKSESFKMNLNRNPNDWFFTDLNNKIFRGYRIKPFKIEIPDSQFELKITIAKNLLKKKVKIEIIAEALDMKIEELNDRIFGTKKDNTINNLECTNSKKVQKSPFEDVYIPLTRGINSIGISNNEITW